MKRADIGKEATCRGGLCNRCHDGEKCFFWKGILSICPDIGNTIPKYLKDRIFNSYYTEEHKPLKERGGRENNILLY